MKSEIEQYADFSRIRYAQCWEDADILLKALQVKEGGHYVSIASAGDNSFAILANNPGKVIAVDLNESQLCCVELRKEAYRSLNYEEFLHFAGVTEGNKNQREDIYFSIRNQLSVPCRKFWDKNLDVIRKGFIHGGKFEHYFELFRKYILRLVHSKKCIDSMFRARTESERIQFYYKVWNNRRWRLLYHIFFSRRLLGKIGRDEAFFNYVDGNVAERILRRTERGFFKVPMHENPYLHYVVYGSYDLNVLPYAFRKENFEVIKKNIDRLEIRKQSLEEYLKEIPESEVDGFNLSDIFEYMSEENMQFLYEKILKASKSGARLAYWNMLVPRSCPKKFYTKVNRKKELSKKLTLEDKAYFYHHFVVEEVK